MKPPIDLGRTMTIQIPALEWICNSDSYLRTVDSITQQISPYPVQGSLSSHLDMEGVQPDEMRWTPLLELRSRDPYIRKLRDFFPGLYFMTRQDPFGASSSLSLPRTRPPSALGRLFMSSSGSSERSRQRR